MRVLAMQSKCAIQMFSFFTMKNEVRLLQFKIISLKKKKKTNAKPAAVDALQWIWKDELQSNRNKQLFMHIKETHCKA